MTKEFARTGTFTNSNGDTFTITGVPFMLFEQMRIAQENQWKLKGKKLPVVPTYTTEIDEVFDWDEESIKLDGTDEDKKTWAEYDKVFMEFESEFNLKRMDVAFLNIADDPLKDEEWIQLMEVTGIPIPEKRSELMKLYGRSKVITSGGGENADLLENDLIRLFIGIQALSGMIDPERAKAYEDSFRDHIQRTAAKSNGGGNTKKRRKRKLSSKQPVSSDAGG